MVSDGNPPDRPRGPPVAVLRGRGGNGVSASLAKVSKEFPAKAEDAKHSRENTRSFVTYIVALVYGLGILMLMGRGIYQSNGIDDIIQLADILEKLLLPVVTLVLGFYYGTQDKD